MHWRDPLEGGDLFVGPFSETLLTAWVVPLLPPPPHGQGQVLVTVLLKVVKHIWFLVL
jgi:hypothetical protein